MLDLSPTTGDQPLYCAMTLSPEGLVINLPPLKAVDDDEAISLAKAMVDGHAIEIWEGLRFIEHIDPVQPQP